MTASTADAVARLRNELAGYFDSKAQFRRDKASGKHWTDHTNLNHAQSLEAVVAYVQALPDDNPTLQLLHQEGVDTFDAGDDAHNFAIHCGSRDHAFTTQDAEGLAEWFAEWAKIALGSKDADNTPVSQEDLQDPAFQSYLRDELLEPEPIAPDSEDYAETDPTKSPAEQYRQAQANKLVRLCRDWKETDRGSREPRSVQIHAAGIKTTADVKSLGSAVAADVLTGAISEKQADNMLKDAGAKLKTLTTTPKRVGEQPKKPARKS